MIVKSYTKISTTAWQGGADQGRVSLPLFSYYQSVRRLLALAFRRRRFYWIYGGSMPEMAHDSARADLSKPEDLSLLHEVSFATAGNSRLEMCIQCGTCGGSCPAGADMDHTPRMIFAMLRAGLREEVLRSNTPWICVSCYQCVVRCPQEIHITDVMYTLKSMAIEANLYREASPPAFSHTFVDMVENYGRSFELGLATRHYLRHYPLRLPGMVPMSLGLLTKKRLSLAPHRIKKMEQLTAILDKAKELELKS